MDYEKKYKDALEIAKKVYHDHRKDRYWRDWLTKLFPELKESEDERIRKEILNVFNQLDEDTTICGRNYDYAKWIAWLEKQGEKKNTRKREIDDAYLQGVCDAKHEIEKQAKKLDADNVWLQNYLSNVICFVNQFKKDFGL